MKKILLILMSLILITNLLFPNPVGVKRSSDKGIYIVLAIATFGIGLLIYDLISSKNKVEFIGEKIDISVNEKNQVTVYGLYNFSRSSKSKKNFNIVYPFPDQDEYGEVSIDFIKVNGNLVDFMRDDLISKDMISLELVFDDFGKSTFEISFTQDPGNSSYKYILLTTKSWMRSLDYCEINIYYPTDFSIDVNYPNFVANSSDNEDKSSLNFIRKDFMPENDLFIKWY